MVDKFVNMYYYCNYNEHVSEMVFIKPKKARSISVSFIKFSETLTLIRDSRYSGARTSYKKLRGRSVYAYTMCHFRIIPRNVFGESLLWADKNYPKGGEVYKEVKYNVTQSIPRRCRPFVYGFYLTPAKWKSILKR